MTGVVNNLAHAVLKQGMNIAATLVKEKLMTCWFDSTSYVFRHYYNEPEPDLAGLTWREPDILVQFVNKSSWIVHLT